MAMQDNAVVWDLTWKLSRRGGHYEFEAAGWAWDQEKMMEIQRLRNLTTGRLHTEIGHVYEDLGIIIGENVLMAHMLPRAARAVEPWLREHVTEPRFWDGEYDPYHTGEIALPNPTDADRKAMFERYAAQPNPIEGAELEGSERCNSVLS